MHRKHRNSRMLLTVIGLSGRGPALRDAPSDSGAGDGTNGGGGTNTGGDGGDDKGGSGTGEDDKNPQIKGDLDPDRASRAIAAARDGEKAAKQALKAEKDRVAAILKAAGLAPDGKEDPTEQLKAAAAERDKALASARDNAVDLAVYRYAAKPNSGINADAVLDSRKFRSDIADLDPSAADFADKVEAAAKAALKANPSLGTKPATGRMGTDVTGSGGGGNTRSKNLDDAVAKKLGGA